MYFILPLSEAPTAGGLRLGRLLLHLLLLGLLAVLPVGEDYFPLDLVSDDGHPPRPRLRARRGLDLLLGAGAEGGGRGAVNAQEGVEVSVVEEGRHPALVLSRALGNGSVKKHGYQKWDYK